ncbi:MAG: hydrogenase 3 maturation endopeptidase HyCI [Deltaproteobacteria bacterium]
MKQRLARLLKGKIVIVGIGNPLRGDDGLGPLLVGRLKGRVPAVCIDAGSAPENYAGAVIREEPDTVLLIDSVHLGEAPGSAALLEEDEIARSGLSTHDIPLSMFIGYLKSRTRARVFLLGVEPQSLAFGEGICEAVQKSLETIAKDIMEVLTCTKPT